MTESYIFFEKRKVVGSGGRDRTADLGVMNPNSAAEYKAFQRINRNFRGETVV